MFEQMKMAGALAGLMKNKDKLAEAGQRIQQRLDDLRAVGQAGSGAVRVTVNGKMHVLSVELEPALAEHLTEDEQSKSMAESLIAEATNDAITKAQSMAHHEISRETQDLGLPDLPGMDSLLG